MFRSTLVLPLLALALMTMSYAQTPGVRSAESEVVSPTTINVPTPVQKASDSVSPSPLSSLVPADPNSSNATSPATPEKKKHSWLKALGSKKVMGEVLRSAATEFTLVRMGMVAGLMPLPQTVMANVGGIGAPLPMSTPVVQGTVQGVYPMMATNVSYAYAPQGQPIMMPAMPGPVVAQPAEAGLGILPAQAPQPGITPGIPPQVSPAAAGAVLPVQMDGAQVQRFVLPDGRVLLIVGNGAAVPQSALNPAMQSNVLHPEPVNTVAPHK